MERSIDGMKLELLSIQYLRAIAALMIVVFHTIHNNSLFENEWIVRNSGFLPAGVDIFFVISGFVMWYTTRSAGSTPKKFIVSRLIRIAPIYWIVTLATCLIAFLRPDWMRSTVFNVEHTIASLLFVPWPKPKFPDQIFPVIGVGWTLNYEMFFYFMFATGLFIRSKYAVIYYALLFAGVVFGARLVPNSVVRDFYGDTIMFEFALGILLGALVTSGVRLSRGASVALLFFGLVLFPFSEEFGDWRFLLWGIPAFAVVGGAVFYELASFVPVCGALKHLGDASYSIYLIHSIVIAVAVKLVGMIGPHPTELGRAFGFAALAVAASCLAGFASFRLIERPASQAIRRWLAEGRPASGSVQARDG
jgi:exopolysaccharide production protein ExoZ